MSKDISRRIRLIWSIVMSILIVIVGVLLILSAVDIYQSGSRPYTPESIRTHFDAIALPIYLALIWAVGGGILALALPAPANKLKGKVPLSVSLIRLSTKVDLDRIPSELSEGIRRERSERRTTRIIGAALYAIGTILSLLYMLKPTHFSFAAATANRDILRGALVVAACMGIPFLYSTIMLWLTARGMRRELALLKTALSHTAPTPQVASDEGTKPPAPTVATRVADFFRTHRKEILLTARCVILILSAVFIIVGIANGGAADLYQKASKLCKECVGMG